MRLSFASATSLLLTGTGMCAAGGEEAAVVELRQVIAELVEIKDTTSAESSDWQARKASMAALLGLHRRELALLEEELAKAGQSAGGFDDRKREAEAGIAELKEVRRQAREALAAQRERALALAKRLPAPLAAEAAPEIERLESWTGDEPREALQAVLGLISKAEQFNRRLTRASEIRDGREVEVLYLGLARAYYADRSGNAGVGVPGATGWEWRAAPELQGEVLKAFDQLDRKRPPELVDLPVGILGKGGGR